MHIITVLTAAVLLCASCKIDNDHDSTPADPEAGYFEDYESVGGKWGFIDTSGMTVIPARFDLVSGFQEDLAPVNFEGKWGYIDRTGTIVIQCLYRATWQFHEGIGRILRFDGSPCLIFRDGKTICPEDVADIGDFKEGLAPFMRHGLYGFLDSTGSVVIEPMYEAVWNFNRNAARVTLQGKSGLINKSGEFIVKAEYERVYPPSAGRILVKSDGAYTFLNMSGDRIGTTYDQALPYADSIAAVADASGWYLIDINGRPLFVERYGHIRYATGQRWIARQANMSGVLDQTGRPLTSFVYDQINNYSEGYAGYLRNELWGFLDSEGTEITPPQFGLVWDFHDGLARAAFRDGIAFVTPEGRIPFIPDYSDARDFQELMAPFQE